MTRPAPIGHRRRRAPTGCSPRDRGTMRCASKKISIKSLVEKVHANGERGEPRFSHATRPAGPALWSLHLLRRSSAALFLVLRFRVDLQASGLVGRRIEARAHLVA